MRIKYQNMWRRKEILKFQSLLYPYVSKRMFHVGYCRLVRGINSARYKTEYLPELKEKPSGSDMHVFKSNENFYGIEGDKGVILVEGDNSVKSEKSVIQNQEKKYVEKVSPAAFGVIRCDYQNKVKYHGQYEDDFNYVLNRKDRTSVLKSISIPLKNVENKSITPEEICQNYSENQNSINGGSENKRFEIQKESEKFDNCERLSESKFQEIGSDTFKENSPSNSYVDQNYFKDSIVKEENLFSKKVLHSEIDNRHSSEENLSLRNNEKNYDASLWSENIQTKINNHVVADTNNNSSFIESQYFQTSVKNNVTEINHSNLNAVLHSEVGDHHSSEETFLAKNNKQNYDASLMLENVQTKLSDNIVTDTNNSSSFIEEQYFQTSVKNDATEINHSNFDSSNSDLDLHDSSIEKISSEYIGFNSCNFQVPPEFFQKNKMSEVNKDSLDLHRAEELNNKRANEHNDNFSPRNDNELKEIAQYSNSCNNQTDRKSVSFKHALSESLETNLKSTAGKFLLSNDLNYKDAAKHDENVNFAKNHKHPTELGIALKEEEIQTAYDFAKTLRAKENVSHSYIQNGKIVIPKEYKRDSKGFKILENQVPDFSNCTNDEIIELLRNSVLYSDDNLIVLNKPYNLVIHESETTKDRCLSSLLEDLAKDLDQKNDCPKLFTVHRLDKETTGCLLLARNEIMAQTLKSYFAQRKIFKKYFIITSKVPEPLEGIIDIPIAEGFVQKKSRMVLQPQIPSDIKYHNHCKNGKRAVTQYKVLSSTCNAALVEVRPETGIKHQIRVHFGFGLSCPILGDHKYSHLTKMAPQKLQADILQKLYVRQSKARYIPLHIHAQSIIIPQYFENRNFFVSAPLPEHMKRSMKALKLLK